jgi:hypothetical protein
MVFQAPEGLWNRAADQVRLDGFSPGALAYDRHARRLAGDLRAGAEDRAGRRGTTRRTGHYPHPADRTDLSARALSAL